MPADMTLLEKIRGRRTRDIQLPNDDNVIDDRILAKREKTTVNPLTRMGARVQRLRQRSTKRGSRR